MQFGTLNFLLSHWFFQSYGQMQISFYGFITLMAKCSAVSKFSYLYSLNAVRYSEFSTLSLVFSILWPNADQFLWIHHSNGQMQCGFKVFISIFSKCSSVL